MTADKCRDETRREMPFVTINFSNVDFDICTLRQGLSPDAVTKYIQSLPLKSYGSQFPFLAAHDVLLTSSFLADLISRMIAAVHRHDAKLGSSRVQSSASFQVLSTFIQVGQGISVTIDPNNRPTFLEVATALRD
jgi:hypothetical protein